MEVPNFAKHSMKQIGAKFNMISRITPSILLQRDTLMSLDLGFNRFCDLQEVVSILRQLNALRHLVLAGNPMSLYAQYRHYVISQMPQLRYLDGYGDGEGAISREEREALITSPPAVLPDVLSVNVSIYLDFLIGTAPPAPPPPAENPDDTPTTKFEYVICSM